MRDVSGQMAPPREAFPEGLTQPRNFPGPREALARAAWKTISQNPEIHRTIRQLAEEFHVSETYLKKTFREVYQAPLYTYSRREKMRQAGMLLRQTQAGILEIAGKVGYDNGSKFAKAFRAEMGMSPSQYRVEHRKKR